MSDHNRMTMYYGTLVTKLYIVTFPKILQTLPYTFKTSHIDTCIYQKSQSSVSCRDCDDVGNNTMVTKRQ